MEISVSYREVYQQCQSLPISIKRTVIIEITEKVSNLSIEWCMSGLNIENLRGIYVHPVYVPESKFRNVNKNGGPVIVVARDLNRCWKRLVIIKELMHVFDTEEQKASKESDLEDIVSAFASDVKSEVLSSPVVQSENLALYMALGLLCPQDKIVEFRECRKENTMSDYDIALAFRIPEQYVPLIMNPSFDKIISSIILEEQ